MRDTIFWNEDDTASSTFVQQFKGSGISRYASFTSFHVRHPSQQTAHVNKLLSILEVDVLPTIFYDGQAFQGAAAFEWLDSQISEIRGASDNRPVPGQDRRDRTRDPRDLRERDNLRDNSRDNSSNNYQAENRQQDLQLAPMQPGADGLAPFDSDPAPFQNMAENAFHNVVAGSDRRGISEDQLRAAENERLSQLPPPVTRK